MKSVHAALLFASAAAIVGCGSKTTPTGTTAPTAGVSATGPVAVTTVAAISGQADAATLAKAGEFAKELQAGKLKAALLTPAFKKLIAPATTEADKAQGYSDWGAESWLAEHAKGASAEQAKGLMLDANTTLVTARSAAGRTLMRLVKSGSGFLIDWIDVTTAVGEFDFSQAPAPAFAAVAFLDALLTKQAKLAESLLAPAGAKKIAPPLDDADGKRGYNAGILGIKLNNFRGSSVGADKLALAKDGVAYALTGELTGAGEARRFTIKLTIVNGTWLVEEFMPN